MPSDTTGSGNAETFLVSVPADTSAGSPSDDDLKAAITESGGTIIKTFSFSGRPTVHTVKLDVNRVATLKSKIPQATVEKNSDIQLF